VAGGPTRGTIRVRAGSVRSMLGSTPRPSHAALFLLHSATFTQLARFSGDGAARSAAARSLTDAAYMST
jgi:hypothetical protein